MTTVPAGEMARLLTVLRDEYQGSVDELLGAARRGAVARSSRRRPPDPVPLRSAGDVLEAVRLRLITRDEARRLLGLRPKPASTSARVRAGSLVPEAIGGVVRGGAA